MIQYRVDNSYVHVKIQHAFVKCIRTSICLRHTTASGERLVRVHVDVILSGLSCPIVLEQWYHLSR